MKNIKKTMALVMAIIMAASMITANNSETAVNKDSIKKVSAASEEANKNKKDISDAKDKISDLKKQQEELDKQIADAQKGVKDEETKQKTIQKQIDTVSKTIQTLQESIKDINKKITALEKSIDESEKKIKDKKSEIEKGVSDFKERVRAMYISGNTSYSNILIGSTDFYDMLMKIELVKRVADHDNSMIDHLIELKDQYEAEEAKLKKNKKELLSNRAEKQSQQADSQEQKDKLDKLFEQSQAAIDRMKLDEKTFKENADKIKKEHEAFEEDLQELYKEREKIKKKEEEKKRKEEEERQRRAEEERQRREAEEAERRRQEEQQNNNSNNDDSSENSNNNNSTSGNSNSNDAYGYHQKSQFTWPVPGFYHISYGVGWRWGAYHQGIDIYSPNIRGANICAAASGTVIRVNNNCIHDWGKNGSCGCGGGYGNYCIIDHGNGYWTLYGHSQHMNVSVGQYVTQGQVLGIVGSTGYSTGDHLHFEIRLNGVALDPSKYV